MTINLSASPYSAAEKSGPEVNWAGHPPLGHNMGPITKFSGRGMKPSVLQSETWHKAGYPGRAGAGVPSFPCLTFTYKGGHLGEILSWVPASPEKRNERFQILETQGHTDVPDAKDIWNTQGH